VAGGIDFFEGALWARFDRGRSQSGTCATSVQSSIAAGQRLVCSDERSCRQGITLTLWTIGVFPMTHHVECVALLVRA
jgi:hypothetical protein